MTQAISRPENDACPATAPACWRSIEASEDRCLFCSSDRMPQETLGLWREGLGAA